MATEGRVAAIFRDDVPVQGAASSPDLLADLVRRAGYGVRLIDADGLASEKELDASKVFLVVLPYGATFPAAAQQNFQRYLAAGGDFVSMGGYAFDNLVVRDRQGKWIRQREIPWEEIAIGGDFEAGGDRWQATGAIRPQVRDKEGRQGTRGGCVQVDEKPGTAEFFLDLEPRAGCEYEFSGSLKPEITTPGGYAFLAWYQFDAQGKILAWKDIALVGSTGFQPVRLRWSRYAHKFNAAPGAVKLRLRAGIYDATGKAWFDDLRLRVRPQTMPMNTRTGEPQDGLVVKPEQIGVFDPSYTLDRVRSAAGSGFIFPESARMEGRLTGFAASAVLGWNDARWLPLINTYDRYGRLRGAAGALIRNYAGRYRGSQWAIFGIDNADLFRAGSPFAEGFVRLLRVMEKETYIQRLTTDFAHYKPGEQVKVKVEVVNSSRQQHDFEVCVEMRAISRDGHEGVQDRFRYRGRAQPGLTEMHEEIKRYNVPFVEGRWRVEATLAVDGQTVDRAETGFTAESKSDRVEGPKFEFKDNYIRIGGKQHFWTGTDTYSNIIFSAQQNALTLDRHIRMARDHGIAVWETLLPGPLSYPKPYILPEEHARRYETIAQLTQRHGMAFLPGLLIGFDVCASEAELGKEAGYLRQFAKRFANTSAMMYYINGDLAWRGDSEELRRLYLRQHPGPRLEPRTAGKWNDMAAVRWHRYCVWLTRRWLSAHHAALREADPHHQTTVEFYREPFGAIDIRAALGPVNLGNIGFFGLPGRDIAEFPGMFKFSDMRATGQGMSIGEFGVKTHPAWSGPYDYHTTRTQQEQFNLFLAITHYALGLGGCKVYNWCWQDAPENIFPWGLVHAPDGVPKDALRLYRNIALLYRMFEPVYRQPLVYLVSPESNRIGPGGERITKAMFSAARALISTGVDFGVVNEEQLSALPKSVRLLVYPLPYCPSDAVFEELVRRVKAGAVLYFSGDISFSPERERDREQRLRELAGVKLADPPSDPFEALQRKPAVLTSAALSPVPGSNRSAVGEQRRCSGRGRTSAPPLRLAGCRFHVRQFGKGQVIYCPRPVELEEDQSGLQRIYQSVVSLAGCVRVPVVLSNDRVDRFEVPIRSGRAFVFFNRGDRSGWAQAGGVKVGLDPHSAGLLLFDPKGGLIAAEGAHRCWRDGKLLVDTGRHFIIASLDGRDLAKSDALLFMPTTANQVRLPFLAGRGFAAQVGEVRDGQWAALEHLETINGKVKVDEDRALEMIVLSRPGELARWGNRIADLMWPRAAL
jgi:hypothetical protein